MEDLKEIEEKLIRQSEEEDKKISDMQNTKQQLADELREKRERIEALQRIEALTKDLQEKVAQRCDLEQDIKEMTKEKFAVDKKLYKVTIGEGGGNTEKKNTICLFRNNSTYCNILIFPQYMFIVLTKKKCKC